MYFEVTCMQYGVFSFYTFQSWQSVDHFFKKASWDREGPFCVFGIPGAGSENFESEVD